MHAAERRDVEVDFSRPAGKLRPLHGINKGPLAAGGLISVAKEHRAAGIPWTRLHDCHWPNPDVVDIHVVFPNPDADPELPESYDFRRTDEHIAAVRATGAGIIYRLGESIEHTADRRHAHPPADPEKWARICLGVIRHYNEGWAQGFRHGIKYWEIWNEPENRPAMWSGSDADYFRLYASAARAIKTRFPAVKVGGPAVGNSGTLTGEKFEPSQFVKDFLTFCRSKELPLDFFSWHCYTDNPRELVARAKGIRRLLDEHGFTGAESHLNEWNYLPGNSWSGIMREAAAEERQRTYEEMAGAPGAAFLTAALLQLQDAPVEICNLFHGELGSFGLFNEYGVPQKNYHALRAFRGLLDASHRVEARTSGAFTATAGLDPQKRSARLLLSYFAPEPGEALLQIRDLPWTGGVIVEVALIDSRRSLGEASRHEFDTASFQLPLRFSSHTVALLTIRPAGGEASEN